MRAPELSMICLIESCRRWFALPSHIDVAADVSAVTATERVDR